MSAGAARNSFKECLIAARRPPSDPWVGASRSGRTDRFSAAAMTMMATTAVRDPCAAVGRRGPRDRRPGARAGAAPAPSRGDRRRSAGSIAAGRGGGRGRIRASAVCGLRSAHTDRTGRFRARAPRAPPRRRSWQSPCAAATGPERSLSQRRRRVASDFASCRMVVALPRGIPRCNIRSYGGSTVVWSRGSRCQMLRIRNATFVARGAALVVLGALVAPGATAHAAEPAPSVRAHATRRAGPIAIDGRLDEAAWAAAPKQSGFMQRFPKDATPPSVDTRFAIIYDDDAVYVGVWADDPRPDLIRALLTRRDVDAPADAVTVGVRQLPRSPDRLRVPAQRRRRAARHAAVRRLQLRRHVGRGVDRRRRGDRVGVDRRVPHPAQPAAVRQRRYPGVGIPDRARDRPDRRAGQRGRRGRAARRRWSASSAWSTASIDVGGRPPARAPAVRHDRRSIACRSTPAIRSTGRYNWRRGVGLDLEVRPRARRSRCRRRSTPTSARSRPIPRRSTCRGTSCSSPRSGRSSSRASTCSSCRSATATAPSRARSTAGGSAPRRRRPTRATTSSRRRTSTTIYGAAKLTGKTPGGWSVGLFDAVTGSDDHRDRDRSRRHRRRRDRGPSWRRRR